MGKSQVEMFSAYNPPPSVGLECPPEEKKTLESEAAGCDINKIVARYVKDGSLPPFKEGVFTDVSEVGDYRSALERVRAADALFMTLPPQVRAKFENDTGAFIEFMADPANKDKAVEYGIIEAPPPAAPPTPEGAGDA